MDMLMQRESGGDGQGLMVPTMYTEVLQNPNSRSRNEVDEAVLNLASLHLLGEIWNEQWRTFMSMSM